MIAVATSHHNRNFTIRMGQTSGRLARNGVRGDHWLLPRTGLPGSQGQLSDVNQTVESHQPLPAHQQLSSGFELRRKVRTLLESPRLNAADNFCAVSSSRAPKQGTNIAAQTNHASKWSVPVRVTRIMPPAPGIPPGPSAGVRGNSKRPCNRRASSQTSNGAVAPAFT